MGNEWRDKPRRTPDYGGGNVGKGGNVEVGCRKKMFMLPFVAILVLGRHVFRRKA